MKQILLLFCLGICQCFHAQITDTREFETSETGLMYGIEDMQTLRNLVEKEQIRFRSCDLDRDYYSYPQAPAIFFKFEADKPIIRGIEKKMLNGLSFNELKNEFSAFLISADSSKTVVFSQGDLAKQILVGSGETGFYGSSFDKKASSPVSDNGWFWTPSDDYLSGYYLLEPLSTTRLPNEYARLIQYVDCMVDTSTTIFPNDLSGLRPHNSSAKKTDLQYQLPIISYITSKMGLPPGSKKRQNYLSNEMIEFAIENLQSDSAFHQVFAACVKEILDAGNSAYGLQVFAGKMKLYELELDLIRSYRQVGICSQDSRPREQALQIAKLAGKVQRWDIFMRAHLNILNDRFARNSDGSYAWRARKTYLRELEALDLNVVDLMFGLSLRAKNLAANHYEGTIWRVGMAMSESKDSLSFESRAKAMIADGRLDRFNRGLIELLFNEYKSSKKLREEEIAEYNRKKEASRYFSFINPK